MKTKNNLSRKLRIVSALLAVYSSAVLIAVPATLPPMDAVQTFAYFFIVFLGYITSAIYYAYSKTLSTK